MSELSEKWRKQRAHTYASENADRYRGFDAGLLRCADELKARDAQIRALAEKAGIAIRDLNTPRETAEKFIEEILQETRSTLPSKEAFEWADRLESQSTSRPLRLLLAREYDAVRTEAQQAMREGSSQNCEWLETCTKRLAAAEKLAQALKWALDYPKHDCEFFSNPEKGTCDFCEQYGKAKAELDSWKEWFGT